MDNTGGKPLKEEIIKYGINVRECPHINAYNPNKPYKLLHQCYNSESGWEANR